jgi:DUF1009 family protein
MLALIAGTGDLPPALMARFSDSVIVCALEGFEPSLDVQIPFRIEHLGSFLHLLKDRGVTQICMAGAIRRPPIDPAQIDAATMPLVPRIQAVIAKGDDGALRDVISIFEDHGFSVKAAHEIAPDLLPITGVLTKAQPAAWHEADAKVGAATIAEMGAADIGQACIVRVGQVAAREDADGTDAMLKQFHDTFLEPPTETLWEDFAKTFNGVVTAVKGTDNATVNADDGILFKAPKPNQDRRADLPVIGLQTAVAAAEAGLAGIVIEANGVMVLDLKGVIETLDMQGMFLWVRPSEAS